MDNDSLVQVERSEMANGDPVVVFPVVVFPVVADAGAVDPSQSGEEGHRHNPCPSYQYSRRVAEGTSVVRTAFAGNIIPSNRFDPTAVRLKAEIPLPNRAGYIGREIKHGFKLTF